MAHDSFVEEKTEETRGQHTHRHRNSDERFEEEVKAFSEDNTKLAREIITLKKELSRLHYKVKTYQEKNRTFHFISNSIIIFLLALIAYKMFMGR